MPSLAPEIQFSIFGSFFRFISHFYKSEVFILVFNSVVFKKFSAYETKVIERP